MKVGVGPADGRRTRQNREHWIVSDCALVSWRDGRIEISSPVSGVTFTSDSADVLVLLHAFAGPRQVKHVIRDFNAYAQDEIAARIRDLIEAQILVAPQAGDGRHEAGWERSALTFHRVSRAPGFARRRGGSSEAIAPARPTQPIELGRGIAPPHRDLGDVLAARCSRRTWPRMPIGRERFASLLWMSARNRGVEHDDQGGTHVSRPYPSGGARYSLEVFPVLAPGAVEALPGGVHRYLPESAELDLISSRPADSAPFLEAAGRAAGSAPPPVLLLIASRYARQSEPYGRLAYSLVLKEVGCLFQTLYLVAEHLGLAACALGGGTPDKLLAALCDTSELELPVVGEFMIGPR